MTGRVDVDRAPSVVSVSDLVVDSPNGTRLIDGISFDVTRGGRTAIIGETGSGKSLTTQALVGLLPTGMTVSGSICWSVDGQQIEAVGASDRTLRGIRGRHAAIIFQEPLTALDPLMRVGGQVAEPIRAHQGLRREALDRAVIDALAEVRLAEPERIARAYPHEISGGQRQRVAIAMALACKPTLLIADEATTALDVTVQADILALLRDLVDQKGLTLLLVTHDIGVVARIASEVLVLRHGRLLESGPLTRVLERPSEAYTRSLIAGARQLEKALLEGDGGRP